tara:strand:- start:17114 stop:17587 length:474 start_codon:yes stop_codon:yes gene_type:complete
MAGRRPKPKALKEAAGNPGKRPINQDEPEFEQLLNIEHPEWIEDEIAIQCWQHYCPLLCSSGVMTLADIHNLEMFCMAYATWRHSIAMAGKEITILQENGTLKKNPALSAANESFKQVQSIGALMGLDPANRTKIVVPGGGKPKDNKFEAMMRLMKK